MVEAGVRRSGAEASGVAALLATVAGLVLLFDGLSDAVPLVFGGTSAERQAIGHGRLLVLVALAALLVAGGLHLWRERHVLGAVLALPGVVCPALAFAFPHAAYAWLAFLPLAPLALGAAIAGAVPRVGTNAGTGAP